MFVCVRMLWNVETSMHSTVGKITNVAFKLESIAVNKLIIVTRIEI